VVGFAAPGDVLVIDSVDVRVVVPVMTLLVGRVPASCVVVAVATTGGVSVAVGAIVSWGGVAVGGATGGVANHDLSGSMVLLLTTYTVAASGVFT